MSKYGFLLCQLHSAYCVVFRNHMNMDVPFCTMNRGIQNTELCFRMSERVYHSINIIFVINILKTFLKKKIIFVIFNICDYSDNH